MHSGADDRQSRPGCPIRKSLDQSLIASSPGLIAGFHVLHRLLTPRHPPRALGSLITSTLRRCHPSRYDYRDDPAGNHTNRCRPGKPSGHARYSVLDILTQQHFLSTCQRASRRDRSPSAIRFGPPEPAANRLIRSTDDLERATYLNRPNRPVNASGALSTYFFHTLRPIAGTRKKVVGFGRRPWKVSNFECRSRSLKKLLGCKHVLPLGRLRRPVPLFYCPYRPGQAFT